MLNDRQRQLVVLLFICSVFVSSALTAKFDTVDSMWAIFNIPAYLLVLLSPTWLVVSVVILAMLFVKYASEIGATPENVQNTALMSELIVGSVVNIVLFLIVSFFIIKLDRKLKKEKEKKGRSKKC